MENLDYCCYKKNPDRLSYLHLACGSIRLIKIVRHMGNMLSCLLEYDIMSIGIWYHIYWNMASYLLEYGIIFIGMWHHIYWNMMPYSNKYDATFQ